MTKFFLKRLLRGIGSIIVVVAIVMTLVYSLMNRKLIFANDNTYMHTSANKKTLYEYSKLEEYGYLDYVHYNDWLTQLMLNGEIDQETKSQASKIARKSANDSEFVAEYVKRFTDYYKSRGYTVIRLDALMITKTKVRDGGNQELFAYKDKPLINRLWNYFSGLIRVDNIHYVKDDIADRGLKFYLNDPIYGGDKFSPAIIGTGTQFRYLLYFDDRFPFMHQNLITINLGKSYTISQGNDIGITMTNAQGEQLYKEVTYPTGLTEKTTDDLHMVTYNRTENAKLEMTLERYGDSDYTKVQSYYKAGLSKVGYSFVIGIISSVIAYMLGIPLGVVMARNKDKLVDKLGTIYIVFIIAVPSLAYIFLFKAVGRKAGLPDSFQMDNTGNLLMYILPIISLALPAIAGLMKWLRRYMIDQMNSDYVKFARSGGLSEGEIFSKHILKNAVIPIAHGVPGTVLGALVGALITERVYNVPGAGGLLVDAINAYDNAVIVGMTMFYAALSVLSIILGDILMAMIDPRINYTTKAR